MGASALKTFDSIAQDAFFVKFIESGYIAPSAEALGFTPKTIYYYIKHHQDFAERFEEAKEEAYARQLEAMEREADRRALDGVDHPVTHQGVITDTFKKYSDQLLMFRMKRRDPAYKDSAQLSVTLNQVNAQLDPGGIVSAIVEQLEQATALQMIDIGPGHKELENE